VRITRSEAWRVMMRQTHQPSALVLTRQGVPVLDRSRYAPAEGLQRGGYVLADCDGPPEVILMDWNLPEMSGVDLLRTLRADPRYAAVRVMVVTTETALSQVRAALDAGANEFVMKPFTKEVIQEKLGLLGLV